MIIIIETFGDCYIENQIITYYNHTESTDYTKFDLYLN
jgi:hypothetical protein